MGRTWQSQGQGPFRGGPLRLYWVAGGSRQRGANMDRKSWIAAIAGVAFSALAQAAPFAMVTDIKGEAWATEGGKQKKLAILGYVESPIEVKVEPSTKLSITYFSSGVQYNFDGPARIALEQQAPRVIEGKAAQ